MRHEDLGRFLEEAFDKIEPKDEAQREKLAKMRERLAETQREATAELEKALREAEERKRTWEVDRDRTREKNQKSRDFWEEVFGEFDAQVVELGAIVAASRKG